MSLLSLAPNTISHILYDMDTVYLAKVHMLEAWFSVRQCLGVETFREWSLWDSNWVRGGSPLSPKYLSSISFDIFFFLARGSLVYVLVL